MEAAPLRRSSRRHSVSLVPLEAFGGVGIPAPIREDSPDPLNMDVQPRNDANGARSSTSPNSSQPGTSLPIKKTRPATARKDSAKMQAQALKAAAPGAKKSPPPVVGKKSQIPVTKSEAKTTGKENDTGSASSVAVKNTTPKRPSSSKPSAAGAGKKNPSPSGGIHSITSGVNRIILTTTKNVHSAKEKQKKAEVTPKASPKSKAEASIVVKANNNPRPKIILKTNSKKTTPVTTPTTTSSPRRSPR